MRVPMFILEVVSLAMLLSSQHLCNAAPPFKLSPFDFMLNFSTSKTQYIAFNPDDGLKNRQYYEQKYGQRGAKLIAALGSGLPGTLDHQILDQQQPLEHIDNEKSTTSGEVAA